MEKYIRKTSERILRKHSMDDAVKIKKKYLIVGSVVLAIGGLGFLGAVGTFLYLFLKLMDTENAFKAWLIAIPFLILFVVGSVLTRVGHRLFTDAQETIETPKNKKEKTNKKDKPHKEKKLSEENKRQSRKIKQEKEDEDKSQGENLAERKPALKKTGKKQTSIKSEPSQRKSRKKDA